MLSPIRLVNNINYAVIFFFAGLLITSNSSTSRCRLRGIRVRNWIAVVSFERARDVRISVLEHLHFCVDIWTRNMFRFWLAFRNYTKIIKTVHTKICAELERPK